MFGFKIVRSDEIDKIKQDIDFLFGEIVNIHQTLSKHNEGLSILKDSEVYQEYLNEKRYIEESERLKCIL